jgi:ankyrin repeat protein
MSQQAKVELGRAIKAGDVGRAGAVLDQGGVTLTDDLSTDGRGHTALHFAGGFGQAQLCELFLGRGAQIDLRTKKGSTPLFISSQQGHGACVQLLLGGGADVNLPRHDGTTPLLISSQQGHGACVRLLLGGGADVNLPAHDGATPLLISSQQGHGACVQLLLGGGADVNLPKHDGATPLLISAHQGHRDVVRILLLAGADQAAQYEGSTALQWAERQGHAAVAALLRNPPAPPPSPAPAAGGLGAPPAAATTKPSVKSLADFAAAVPDIDDVNELLRYRATQMAQLFEQYPAVLKDGTKLPGQTQRQDLLAEHAAARRAQRHLQMQMQQMQMQQMQMQQMQMQQMILQQPQHQPPINHPPPIKVEPATKKQRLGPHWDHSRTPSRASQRPETLRQWRLAEQPTFRSLHGMAPSSASMTTMATAVVTGTSSSMPYHPLARKTGLNGSI